MTLDTSNYDEFFDDYLSASTGVLEFDDNTKLIFQGEEGRVGSQIAINLQNFLPRKWLFRVIMAWFIEALLRPTMKTEFVKIKWP